MEIPPRDHLIRRIQAALSAPFSPPLYLHGPSTTGKASTLRAAVSAINNKNESSTATENPAIVTIDCILNHTERQLFSAMTSSSEYLLSDAPSLIHYFRSQNHNDHTTNKLNILFFTRAERLASSSFPISTLPLLFRLPSLTNRPDLRVVLASRVPFTTMRHAHAQPTLQPPLDIFFPPLSQQELINALMQSYIKTTVNQNQNDQDVKIYKNFATSVVNILYRSSNNPLHLQRVVDSLYPEYVNALSEHNAVAAFNRVRDRLSHALTCLNLEDNNSNQLSIEEKENQMKINKTNSITTADKMSGLPRCARVMLVAAYLGSVIAPAQDMRHFSSEKTGRRAGVQKAICNNAIPLERLLAIYEAIRPHDDDFNDPFSSLSTNITTTVNMITTPGIHDDVDINGGVSNAISTPTLIHLSTLVALGWLSREGTTAGATTNATITSLGTGNTDQGLSECKFRCKMTRNEAIELATSLHMPIHDYMVFDSHSST